MNRRHLDNNYRYNELIFCCSEDYDGNKSAMWKDIIDFQNILIRTGCVVKLYADGGDPNFMVVEYAVRDEEISDGPLRWTTWNELDLIESQEECI